MSNVTTTEEQINHVSKITTIFGVWKVHMILSVFQINSYLLQCWRGFSLLLRHVDFMVDWPVFTFPLSSRALRLHIDSCQRPLGPQTHSSLGKYLNTNIFTFIWLKGWAKRTSNTVDKTPTRNVSSSSYIQTGLSANLIRVWEWYVTSYFKVIVS